jgi:hypothetical protein
MPNTMDNLKTKLTEALTEILGWKKVDIKDVEHPCADAQEAGKKAFELDCWTIFEDTGKIKLLILGGTPQEEEKEVSGFTLSETHEAPGGYMDPPDVYVNDIGFHQHDHQVVRALVDRAYDYSMNNFMEAWSMDEYAEEMESNKQ